MKFAFQNIGFYIQLVSLGKKKHLNSWLAFELTFIHPYKVQLTAERLFHVPLSLVLLEDYWHIRGLEEHWMIKSFRWGRLYKDVTDSNYYFSVFFWSFQLTENRNYEVYLYKWVHFFFVLGVRTNLLVKWTVTEVSFFI